MLFSFACEAAGAATHRPSLRPLNFEGASAHGSGEFRRENEDACPQRRTCLSRPVFAGKPVSPSAKTHYGARPVRGGHLEKTKVKSKA
jgi:hypothetical protein